MDRTIQAFAAAERIMNKIEQANLGSDTPHDILDVVWQGGLPNGLYANYGASRLVIWDDECDYVIKMPIDSYDEKYCKREVEIYSAAVEEGLEDLFGWCACYREPEEYKCGIYVMEFLSGNEDEIFDSAWNYGYQKFCDEYGLDSSIEDNREEYEANHYDYNTDNANMLELFESLIDGIKASLLDRFLAKWRINDLHAGNYLYRGTELVICDYAGYGW